MVACEGDPHFFKNDMYPVIFGLWVCCPDIFILTTMHPFINTININKINHFYF